MKKRRSPWIFHRLRRFGIKPLSLLRRQLFRNGMPSQSSLRDASSPKGGATGVPVRPTQDEQSLLYPETVVPCYRGQQLLDKRTLSSYCESL